MKDTLLLTSLSRAILSISQYPISPKRIIPSFQYSLAQTWHARPELHRLCFGNITAKTAYSRQLAPGQAIIPIVSEAS